MAREVRIVPAKSGSSDAMGTEVWCGDQKLKVRAITLHADVIGKHWIATIEVEAIVDGEIIAEPFRGA